MKDSPASGTARLLGSPLTSLAGTIPAPDVGPKCVGGPSSETPPAGCRGRGLVKDQGGRGFSNLLFSLFTAVSLPSKIGGAIF